MKSVTEWLEDKLDSSEIGLEDDASAFEKQAEVLRAEAEAAGYSADELNDACGGDIAEFLRDRQNLATDNELQDKLAGDPVPLALPGIKQE